MPNKITLEILDCSSFAEGHAFGDTGVYERLFGRAHYAVDPNDAAQAVVTDIDKAPVNGDGLVEFSADFLMLRPKDRNRGNKRVFFDYGNRGNLRALQFFNDARHSNDPRTLEHAGNGFLFRRGYSFVWGAWQGDLLPGDDRLTMRLPVATENGSPSPAQCARNLRRWRQLCVFRCRAARAPAATLPFRSIPQRHGSQSDAIHTTNEF